MPESCSKGTISKTLSRGWICLLEINLEDQRKKHSKQVPGSSPFFRVMIRVCSSARWSKPQGTWLCSLCTHRIATTATSNKRAGILSMPSAFYIISNHDGQHWMLDSFLRPLGFRPDCPTNSPYYFLHINLGHWMLISKGSLSSGSLIEYGRSIIKGDTWE